MNTELIKSKNIIDFQNYLNIIEKSAYNINAKVTFIPKLAIDYSLSVKELMSNNLFSKQLNDITLFKKFNKYDITNKVLKEEKIILLKFCEENGSFRKAFIWGIENKLYLTSIHIPISIVLTLKTINIDFGIEPFFIVETMGFVKKDKNYASCLLNINNRNYFHYRDIDNYCNGNIWFTFIYNQD